MKKIITSLLVLSSLVFSDSAIQSASKVQEEKQVCKQELKILDVERSGCCSWHGGVSGCSGGRIVCNDGSLSPSCTCNSIINPLG